MDLSDYPHIAIDDHTCFGKPRISGTRLPLWALLRELAEELPVEALSVKADSRGVSVEAIQDALRFAADLCTGKGLYDIAVQQQSEREAAVDRMFELQPVE